MNKMDYVVERLKEPSTWRGLIWVASSAGLIISPDSAEAIVTLGMLSAGLVGVIASDSQQNAEGFNDQ